MTATLTLRDARPEDAACLSGLALRSKGHWGYSPDFLEACRDELAVEPEGIESARFRYVVAENGADVVGYYALERLSATEYELEALFVEPARIGTGVGRALMQHALAAVESYGGRKVVIQGDPNARRFYLAAGGVEVGMRESGSVPGRYLPIFEIAIPPGTRS
ncbi:MAG: GNAT family N-acetyltransferase [bacterium]|nr:GNAT family N-acetyltransferase [bacterium]